MSKVLLVEDDNNLRDIYEARMQAEGFEIVSAHDGEEGLIVAKNEHPDLIISDVMMPKISGFEMLDIIRATPTLNNVKIIMLTALGQTDDQDRADKLGADRYLVKSQVTLEDIVKVAHEVLNDLPNNPNLNNVPVEPSNDQPTTDNSQQDTLNPNTSNTQESTENQPVFQPLSQPVDDQGSANPVEPSNDQPTTDNSQQDTLNYNQIKSDLPTIEQEENIVDKQINNFIENMNSEDNNSYDTSSNNESTESQPVDDQGSANPVEPSNDQPTTDNSQQDTLNPNTSNTQESTENQQLINQANDQLNINSTNHEPLTPPSVNQQNNGQKIINPISTNRSFLSNPESQPSNNDQSFNEN